MHHFTLFGRILGWTVVKMKRTLQNLKILYVRLFLFHKCGNQVFAIHTSKIALVLT